MSILTQEQLLLNAQKQFDTLKQSILDHSQQQIRIDQAERSLFAELLALGLTLLKAFVAGAGLGDEGKCRKMVTRYIAVTNRVSVYTDRSLGSCRSDVGCTRGVRRRRSSTLRPTHC